MFWPQFILKLVSNPKSHYVPTRSNFSPLLQDAHKAIRVYVVLRFHEILISAGRSYTTRDTAQFNEIFAIQRKTRWFLGIPQ